MFPLLEDCEFIVVACDGMLTVLYSHRCSTYYFCYIICLTGIWDVMSNIEVVEFVRRRIANNMSPSSVSRLVLQLHGAGFECQVT